MFRQMIGVWITIPFIMLFFFILGVVVDFTLKMVNQHFYEVAFGVFVISYIGLTLSIQKVIQNDKHDS